MGDVVASRRIAVFCGGHGAQSFVRALVGEPGLDVVLLVNGYDNGKSTGQIRHLFPGLLGPSDFRKNATIGRGSESTSARREFMEFRLQESMTPQLLGLLARDVSAGQRFPDLDGAVARGAARYLDIAARALEDRYPDLTLSEFALGNLVILGAYLESGEAFNLAIERFVQLLDPPVDILNVTDGQDAYLVALRQNGSVLWDEGEIVEMSGASPIQELFLLDRKSLKERGVLLSGDRTTREWLERRRLVPEIAGHAKHAIETADLIVYAPGTPHSSVLPSLMTSGVASAVRANPHAAKVVISNLAPDRDTPNLDAVGQAALVLRYVQDPTNEHRSVTHLLVPDDDPSAGLGVWRGAHLVSGPLRNSSDRRCHEGPTTAAALRHILAESGRLS